MASNVRCAFASATYDTTLDWATQLSYDTYARVHYYYPSVCQKTRTRLLHDPSRFVHITHEMLNRSVCRPA